VDERRPHRPRPLGSRPWTIAEHAGGPTPDGMQHLLARMVWDHDKVRDDLRDWVVEHLGDPQATLVVDETGDLKKGTRTVWGAAPVHRHRRADREHPGRGLPGVRHRHRARGALADRQGPGRAELIRLTCNEVQHLFAALVARPTGDRGHRLRWSLWRRRHQARARTCHYRRQANAP
jgi:hypothetical protein